ncbi:hypothetical protein [Acinetobacter tjernbergiae]|jgi:hypothetical protein|uniref:Uncharacterized protein n=1 Tax=Acinetobacter tjernbergiae DSM 14971 = CIP 107465 TaxID=1120928 RepID=V2V9G7_9GAMM|nr:hypothetical protein [Acinetobacter tjernbergiae]ESK57555.1 hypothetical protein F990_00091 [Acinetobacter tjernbergiae DSM 14971 = CIP 107465]
MQPEKFNELLNWALVELQQGHPENAIIALSTILAFTETKKPIVYS